ncbi:MAG: von Willebrand factor type A domain-containing protein [Candidatus Electronema aureum]|uniref:von Willebrand factor type A domain-containing protein n=1 Tax=Candidatus Electronema aureum TaxID=2005002 RepID=A0A521G104_9BACT|nr:MAG: von Willebrand factor type A domain-containing protein [Candidatus Electronema aureum]
MRTQKKMLPLLCAMILVSGLAACKDAQQPKQSNLPAAKAASQTVPVAAAQKPLALPWPPAPNGNTVLAPNLLADNYYVVLDGSGSMLERQCSGNQSKIETAKNALKEFAASVPADANLGMLIFTDSQIRELVPIGTGNRQQLAEQVQSASAAGGTPLHEAISAGYAQLEQQAMRQLGYGRYVLVVVTDGQANPGHDPTEKVRWMLDNTPVELHTIGFCIGTDHALNMPGRTVYKAADNPAALRQGLADVLAEAETFDVATFQQ